MAVHETSEQELARAEAVDEVSSYICSLISGIAELYGVRGALADYPEAARPYFEVIGRAIYDLHQLGRING